MRRARLGRKAQATSPFQDLKRRYYERLKELEAKNKKRRNKFNANIVAADGLGNPGGSQLERSVLALYELEQRRGAITMLRHQHQIRFTEADISWRLDFSFLRAGEPRFGEAKGFETEDFKLKLKLWRIWGPAPLELWYGDAKRPYLKEVIFPKYYVAQSVALP